MFTAGLRPIPGYDGYLASDDGRVWSEPKSAGRRHDGRWLTPCLDSSGYPTVGVVVDGKTKRVRVHRLIALAWVPNPAGLPWVNHLDGAKANNRPANLEWCTAAQNNLHAYRTGLNKISARQVANCSRAGKATRGLTFDQAQEVRRQVAAGITQTDIARSLGVRVVTVNAIVRGKTYLHP